MAFHVVVSGSLTLKHSLVEEWLAAPLLVDHLEWLTDSDALPTTLSTAEQLLSHLEAMTVAPHEIIEVYLQGDTVHVNGYLSSDVFEECWAAMSRLFASAAAFDANGSLTVLGYQGIQLGERISVVKGKATHRVLTVTERESAQQEPLVRALEERIQQRFDALVGRGPDTVMKGVNPFTGR